MGNGWDEYAAGWDGNPDVIAYSEQAFGSLTGIAGIEGMEIFDFGCGTGRLTGLVAPAARAVVALDTSPRMIEVLAAKNLAKVTPICGTLADLLAPDEGPYRDRFDLVLASSVCAFVPDYDETLLQLRALLKPGRRLVQWDWLSSGEASGPGFSEARMSEAISGAGFTSVVVNPAFSMSGPEGDATVLMAVARK